MSTYEKNQEAIEKVRDLIKDIDVAMLTTISSDGLVSRPMSTQEVEFDGDLWFMTQKDKSVYRELLENKNVNLAYVDKSYVSVRGEAELIEDRAKLKELWSPMYEKFFGVSSDDPSLVLIKVKAETAEYWEAGNRMKLVKNMFKKLTGNENDESDLNKTVELN
ncbi:pyridoxamine 5'-phosphate oxidase family protein [Paenibacillus chitinolyticus]|uniref:pyridoxamine 5'-phosphate oxidase family protein n=1 Tax=Paenibacillus chitinolyticus TaxID=79263 RepID=UPI003558E038